MENLCSSFFSFTTLAGMGGGVIMGTLSCPCPSPRHGNIFCGSPLSVSLTLRDSLTLSLPKSFDDNDTNAFAASKIARGG